MSERKDSWFFTKSIIEEIYQSPSESFPPKKKRGRKKTLNEATKASQNTKGPTLNSERKKRKTFMREDKKVREIRRLRENYQKLKNETDLEIRKLKKRNHECERQKSQLSEELKQVNKLYTKLHDTLSVLNFNLEKTEKVQKRIINLLNQG